MGDNVAYTAKRGTSPPLKLFLDTKQVIMWNQISYLKTNVELLVKYKFKSFPCVFIYSTIMCK